MGESRRRASRTGAPSQWSSLEVAPLAIPFRSPHQLPLAPSPEELPPSTPELDEDESELSAEEEEDDEEDENREEDEEDEDELLSYVRSSSCGVE